MAEGGGGHEGLMLWENQSWGISNSDNSGGSDKKSGEKQPGSASNSQSTAAAAPGMDLVLSVSDHKKRGRGGAYKNGKKGICEGTEGKGGGGGGGGTDGRTGGTGGTGESDHEIHIWTERERRKKMRNMFSSLHALLPQLPPKVKLHLLQSLDFYRYYVSFSLLSLKLLLFMIVLSCLRFSISFLHG